MTTGIVVRITTEIEVQGAGGATMLAIVATSDRTAAYDAVKRLVSPGCKVEVTDDTVGAKTIERLGLAPGQAHIL